MNKRKVVEYLEGKHSPFGKWFDNLNWSAAAKVTSALYRLVQSNFSNVKPVGKGVSEYKIDYGPGYRIYFGQRGTELIILLGGGSKKSQQKDIKIAQKHWDKYKSIMRKKEE